MAGTVILGKDDLTGADVLFLVGKKHPFVACTKKEIESFKKHLSNRDRVYDGARYGWNHPAGPLAKARQGDPLAAVRVWQVTGDSSMAKKAGVYLQKKAASFDEGEFVKSVWEAPAELEKSALIYDLIADDDVLTVPEKKVIRGYLQRALSALRKLRPYYGEIHNIGTAIDQGAWAAALSLEDTESLKELFLRFKQMVGKGILPGGYWFEGTAYGRMVSSNIKSIVEHGARSGIDLAHLHCRREPLSVKWNVRAGYAQAGEIFDWPFHVMTPFMEIPNIGDGDGPHKLSAYNALTVRDYVNDAELLNRLYSWDLKVNKGPDPHAWGDFSPNPDVVPLDRLEDTFYRETGMFIFRQGTGLDPDNQYVLFLTLPRTGFHMHTVTRAISVSRNTAGG